MGKPEWKRKGKEEPDDEWKEQRYSSTPDIDDTEFADLQARMFEDKGKSKKDGASSESNGDSREKAVRSKRKQRP
jgi:hypothetical protein